MLTMIERSQAWRRGAIVAVAALALAGCANTKNKAPVEDRPPPPRSAPSVGTPPDAGVAEAPKLLPGAENAGKPGYYTVKPGDTMIRIGLENGQNWRDLVKWNNLENPNLIEVGQVLRVIPPGADPASAGARPVTQAKVETRPLDPRAAGGASAPAAGVPVPPANSASGVAVTPPPAASAPPPPTAPRDADDDVNWTWPASGPVATSSTTTAARAWRSPASPATGSTRRRMGGWSMRARGCAATAIS